MRWNIVQKEICDFLLTEYPPPPHPLSQVRKKEVNDWQTEFGNQVLSGTESQLLRKR